MYRSLWLAAVSAAALRAEVSHYRAEPAGAPVERFTLATGGGWQYLRALKPDGTEFRVWTQGTSRYILQEGGERPREFRHAGTGAAVFPLHGEWRQLMPEPAARANLLGRSYRRESAHQGEPPRPDDPFVVLLNPDLLIGPATNRRVKGPRRYDTTDYPMEHLTADEYREMAAAGINWVMVNADQLPHAAEAGMFYWGPAGVASQPFPEILYRSQYLGPAQYLDEPAVGTRDHVLRPRLEKDPAFRKAITPKIAFDAFREHFAHALSARKESDVGGVKIRQRNLFTWETMPATAAYQLSQDPDAPAAFVFEPPGRIGTRRTLPEINMSYGVQIPPTNPKALTAILFGFLRGAARLTGKQWGVSIYGAVERSDTFFWLTHAYDLGATRFHYWDNYQLAAVPYPEYLALSRHLHGHAAQHPARDLVKLRDAAEVLILLPAGYNLGHVQMGKGNLWGVGELNLERRNSRGVAYRTVMRNFFTEIERCIRLGVEFDTLWDLPGIQPVGYRETVRIRDDGKVEIREGARVLALPSARVPVRPAGAPPGLSVQLSRNGLDIAAAAVVKETSAPVFYTTGAGRDGVYRNARVAWELYGPGEEDYQFLPGDPATLQVKFRLPRPGSYRLRAATADTAGRTAVVWTEIR
ncbi:MAG: hypothetical protein FJW39_14365 [Acidobacteria bacterium]|nr:hypothetical protein [Acidobacteriota bacterium]